MPDAWMSNAPGPFVTMERERGVVTVSALGEQRFLVRIDGELSEEREVTGHDEALTFAGELAERLGEPVGYA